MAWFLEPKKVATCRTPVAAIKFFTKIQDVPARLVRLVRCSGMSETDPGRVLKFFIGGVIIDRYEIRIREGSYTIFDTWEK